MNDGVVGDERLDFPEFSVLSEKILGGAPGFVLSSGKVPLSFAEGGVENKCAERLGREEVNDVDRLDLAFDLGVCPVLCALCALCALSSQSSSWSVSSSGRGPSVAIPFVLEQDLVFAACCMPHFSCRKKINTRFLISL